VRPAGSDAPASAPSAAPAAPEAVRKIEMALSTLSATNAPLWVARDYGLFRRQGLDVELTSMSPAAANQALAAGSVPMTVTGGSSVSAYLAGNTEIVFIAGLMNRAHFKVMGRPEIARIEDLRGKSAGSSTAGSGASMALFESLRRFGLEPDRDVSIVYLREQPNIASALLGGAVQGGVLAPPFTQQVQGQGAHILVDMLEFNIELLANNITTTRGFLEREPDLLHRFLMAYVEGIQYARDHKADTVESIIRGTRNEDRGEAESAYDSYRDLWSPWPTEGGIRTVLNNLDEPAAKTARPADMIDDSILRELEQSGWLAANYRP
jgi:NitT/TauT family transport system substrate-binding protein